MIILTEVAPVRIEGHGMDLDPVQSEGGIVEDVLVHGCARYCQAPQLVFVQNVANAIHFLADFIRERDRVNIGALLFIIYIALPLRHRHGIAIVPGYRPQLRAVVIGEDDGLVVAVPDRIHGQIGFRHLSYVKRFEIRRACVFVVLPRVRGVVVPGEFVGAIGIRQVFRKRIARKELHHTVRSHFLPTQHHGVCIGVVGRVHNRQRVQLGQGSEGIIRRRLLPAPAHRRLNFSLGVFGDDHRVAGSNRQPRAGDLAALDMQGRGRRRAAAFCVAMDTGDHAVRHDHVCAIRVCAVPRVYVDGRNTLLGEDGAPVDGNFSVAELGGCVAAHEISAVNGYIIKGHVCVALDDTQELPSACGLRRHRQRAVLNGDLVPLEQLEADILRSSGAHRITVERVGEAAKVKSETGGELALREHDAVAGGVLQQCHGVAILGRRDRRGQRGIVHGADLSNGLRIGIGRGRLAFAIGHSRLDQTVCAVRCIGQHGHIAAVADNGQGLIRGQGECIYLCNFRAGDEGDFRISINRRCRSRRKGGIDQVADLSLFKELALGVVTGAVGQRHSELVANLECAGGIICTGVVTAERVHNVSIGHIIIGTIGDREGPVVESGFHRARIEVRSGVEVLERASIEGQRQIIGRRAVAFRDDDLSAAHFIGVDELNVVERQRGMLAQLVAVEAGEEAAQRPGVAGDRLAVAVDGDVHIGIGGISADIGNMDPRRDYGVGVDVDDAGGVMVRIDAAADGVHRSLQGGVIRDVGVNGHFVVEQAASPIRIAELRGNGRLVTSISIHILRIHRDDGYRRLRLARDQDRIQAGFREDEGRSGKRSEECLFGRGLIHSVGGQGEGELGAIRQVHRRATDLSHDAVPGVVVHVHVEGAVDVNVTVCHDHVAAGTVGVIQRHVFQRDVASAIRRYAGTVLGNDRHVLQRDAADSSSHHDCPSACRFICDAPLEVFTVTGGIRSNGVTVTIQFDRLADGDGRTSVVLHVIRKVLQQRHGVASLSRRKGLGQGGVVGGHTVMGDTGFGVSKDSIGRDVVHGAGDLQRRTDRRGDREGLAVELDLEGRIGSSQLIGACIRQELNPFVFFIIPCLYGRRKGEIVRVDRISILIDGNMHGNRRGGFRSRRRTYRVRCIVGVEHNVAVANVQPNGILCSSPIVVVEVDSVVIADQRPYITNVGKVIAFKVVDIGISRKHNPSTGDSVPGERADIAVKINFGIGEGRTSDRNLGTGFVGRRPFRIESRAHAAEAATINRNGAGGILKAKSIPTAIEGHVGERTGLYVGKDNFVVAEVDRQIADVQFLRLVENVLAIVIGHFVEGQAVAVTNDVYGSVVLIGLADAAAAIGAVGPLIDVGIPIIIGVVSQELDRTAILIDGRQGLLEAGVIGPLVLRRGSGPGDGHASSIGLHSGGCIGGNPNVVAGFVRNIDEFHSVADDVDLAGLAVGEDVLCAAFSFIRIHNIIGLQKDQNLIGVSFFLRGIKSTRKGGIGRARQFIGSRVILHIRQTGNYLQHAIGRFRRFLFPQVVRGNIVLCAVGRRHFRREVAAGDVEDSLFVVQHNYLAGISAALDVDACGARLSAANHDSALVVLGGSRTKGIVPKGERAYISIRIITESILLCGDLDILDE